jgi:hypothetical protein
VIHEIYADPTPSRGLPTSESIELRNRTSSEIDLRNWWLSNGSSSGKITSNFILKPDSSVVITTSGALSAYKTFGAAISISPFPTLDNEGDTLVLYSPLGVAIHAIVWDKSWYQNDIKEEGGWSLEMKDITKPCSGKINWTAATSSVGGTPGKVNSVQSVTKDSTVPHAYYSLMPDSLTLLVFFNEPLGTMPEVTIEGFPILSMNWLPPIFNLLEIHLTRPPPSDSILQVQIGKMNGCSGNSYPGDTVRSGRFASVIKNQIIINEILFNPPAGGSDYVELYNRSEQIVDLGKLMLGNRNSIGKISSLSALSHSSFPFFPGQYILVSEDSNWIHQYYAPREITVIQQPMPSFPDDAGHVVLTDPSGNLLDELGYSEKWHEILISSREGVALERILFAKPTDDPGNWHSASAQNKYGSPGYRNSQSLNSVSTTGNWIKLSSHIISPDLDGKDDVLLIFYKLPQPGFLGNVWVYDSFGRPVISIANNALCGTEGFFRWNGLDRTNKKPNRGTYIIFIEFFHPDGSAKTSKHTIGMW